MIRPSIAPLLLERSAFLGKDDTTRFPSKRCSRTPNLFRAPEAAMLSHYRLKAPLSAILDKPGGQHISVTLPIGAMLLDSPHTSTTLHGMVGVYWEGLHYSVFFNELLKTAEMVQG